MAGSWSSHRAPDNFLERAGLPADLTRLPDGIHQALAAGETLVVPSRQRASAVRLAHARAAVSRGERCWRTPRIVTWRGWLEDVGASALAAEGLRLLSPAAEWLLWRRTLEDLAGDDTTLRRDALVDALQRAADLAAEWSIASRRIAGSPGSEAALLARALTRFHGYCQELRVVGRSALLDRIARAGGAFPTGQLVGFATVTAGQRSCAAARFDLAERLAREAAPGRTHLLAAVDADDELAQAAAWCRARLERDRAQRLLVVVPDLPGRREEVMRCFRQTLAPESAGDPTGQSLPGLLALEGGERLAAHPLVASALEILGLAAYEMEFQRVSAWLRATHHGDLTSPQRAQLDLWLRSRGRSRLDLAALVAELAGAPEFLQPAVRQFAAGCEGVLTALSGARTGLAGWTRRFQVALDAARWPGVRPLSSDEQQTRERLERLLQELSALVDPDRALGLGEALELLRDLAARVSFQPASGDPAVTVTDALCDPVVAYDGIWVMGLHADAWPPSPAPDPFVPVAVQRAAGMPAASVGGQTALARQLLGRYRCAAEDLVVSWPRQLEEAYTLPSALLREIPDARPFPGGYPLLALAGRLRAGARRETFLDETGTRWDAGIPLPAGTRALELQSLCPFRAYAELRLGAAPVPEPRHGIDPRLRGQLLHRALEAFWRELGDQARLLATEERTLAAHIERCVHEAAAETLVDHLRAGQERLALREARRAARLLVALCTLERQRAPFRVLATERALTVRIGQARLSVRIDRIDDVAGLGWAVIDYKTGQPGPREWRGERPTHPQLLAYRQAVGDGVRLLAMACIGREEVAFRGIGQDGAGMRGIETADTVAAGAEQSWFEITREWSLVLARLADAFLAGEAQVDPAHRACDHCHLHAFCRIRRTAMTEEEASGDE